MSNLVSDSDPRISQSIPERVSGRVGSVCSAPGLSGRGYALIQLTAGTRLTGKPVSHSGCLTFVQTRARPVLVVFNGAREIVLSKTTLDLEQMSELTTETHGESQVYTSPLGFMLDSSCGSHPLPARSDLKFSRYSLHSNRNQMAGTSLDKPFSPCSINSCIVVTSM